MADQITNYQCPACGGPLKFDPASGRLTCEYCGSDYATAEIEALYRDKDREAEQAAKKAARKPAPEGSHWSEAEAAGLKVYNCPSCGAELICDGTTAATSCPYCGNPSIVPGQLGGALRPDWVIPFKLDKAEAVQALKKHYRRRPLLPKLFSEQNHLEEIKGVYVPFWLFDGFTEGSVTYKAEKVRHYSQGNYSVTETSHYQVLRGGSVQFARIPADGSSKMPDAHMEAIEPYDMTALQPFSTAFLPGYLADKYDIDATASRPRAESRAEKSTIDAFRDTVEGYSSVTTQNADVAFRTSDTRYALLPVWLLSTTWQGKNFLFAMNGQTGKLIGDLPVSKGRAWAWFLGLWAALFAAVFALLRLL